MDQIAVHHINAFNIQNSEDESGGSYMSGTFNKVNNSLKINQRKQKKSSQTVSDRESVMSGNESMKSFQQDQKSEVKTKAVNNEKSRLPPPPKLVSSLGKHFKAQIEKKMPTLVNFGDKGSNPRKPSSNTSDLLSPNGKRDEHEKPRIQAISIKEELHDSTLNSQRINQDHSISQDQMPFDNEDRFSIKINIKNHSNIPSNVKIPNANYNILEQAKYLLMLEMTQNQDMDFQLNEEMLSRTIKQIHNHLMKVKDLEHEKTLGDYNKQVLSLQAQISLLTSNQGKQNNQSYHGKKHGSHGADTPAAFAMNSLNSQGLNESQNPQQIDIQQTEEFKKLREENQELRMKSQFLEQDLQYQAQKTKDLQLKYENEIDNLRSQLKGSQSEQFVKQQQEHKQLIEDNSILMREVKILQEQLREEQQRVIDLFEDAQQVREEIMKEMGEFEKVKHELSKVKAQNKNLRKKLHDESIEFSEHTGMDEDQYEDENQEYTMQDQTLGGNSIMRDGKKRKVEQVSVAISRPESLLSLANGFNQRLEEVIEEKSKSIINVLTKGHATHMNYHHHPYALNYQYNQTPYQNYHMINQDSQTHSQRMKHQPSSKGQIVEMSLYESEHGGNHNQESSAYLGENHQLSGDSSALNRIMNTNGSDLQILKHKIREVRDKHHSQLHENSMRSLQQNRNSIKSQGPNPYNIDMREKAQIKSNPSYTDTFKAVNSGLIHQDGEPMKIIYRDNQDKKVTKVNFTNGGHEEDMNLQNQFKTPVWTNQFYQDESEDNDDDNQYRDDQSFNEEGYGYKKNKVQSP